MNYHIVGLDLSMTATGICRIRPSGDLAPSIGTSVVTSKSQRDNAGYPDVLDRLRSIIRRVLVDARRGMEPGDVFVVAIEGPSLGSTNGHVHTRAGLWWITYHLLSKEAVVVVIPPKTNKRYMTGSGNASKLDMIAAVTRNFPTLGIVDDNEADALSLACMVARELGFPMEPSVQRVQPAALEAVDWPDVITQQRRTTR